MKNIQSEGIILRRTNYGEADRILNIITPGNGKVSAIAKGVRKASSKLAGSLELLTVINLSLISKHNNLGVVTSARVITFFGNIIKEYERTQLAYEFMKQINRITETVAEPEFYYLLRNSLTSLDNLALDFRLTELWFRIWLALYMGLAVNLVTDVKGDKLAEGMSYDFDFQEMAFTPKMTGKFTPRHIKLLRVISVDNFNLLNRLTGINDVVDDCLWLMRLIET